MFRVNFGAVGCTGIAVGKLNSQALFMHGGSMYRVLGDKGQGVSVRCSQSHTVILNLKCGTLREIRSDIHVEPLTMDQEVCIPVRHVRYEELNSFMKC